MPLLKSKIMSLVAPSKELQANFGHVTEAAAEE